MLLPLIYSLPSTLLSRALLPVNLPVELPGLLLLYAFLMFLLGTLLSKLPKSYRSCASQAFQESLTFVAF